MKDIIEKRYDLYFLIIGTILIFIGIFLVYLHLISHVFYIDRLGGFAFLIGVILLLISLIIYASKKFAMRVYEEHYKDRESLLILEE